MEITPQSESESTQFRTVQEVIDGLPLPADHLRQAREQKRRELLGDYTYERFDGKEKQLLDTYTEIESYLNNLGRWQYDGIETLYEDITEPLPENLSAYVVVPVAAGQEKETLKRTLLQYARQDADPSTWALLLYVNNTDSSRIIESSSAIPETLAIIEEFKAEHPRLTIRAPYTTYHDDEAPAIGEIRADAWNVALYDIYKNGINHEHLIGVSHDADIEWLSPDYISKMQQSAKENPQADLFTCQLSWQNDGNYMSDPNKILRYWEYLGHVSKNKTGHFGASDANTAIRIGTYAAMEGFNRTVYLAEMLDIRDRTAAARRLPFRSTDHMYYVEDIRLKTNSRRIYRAIANGYGPDYAWDQNLPFLTGDDPVRHLDTKELGNLTLTRVKLQTILASMERVNFHKIDPQTSRRLRTTGRHILQLPTA